MMLRKTQEGFALALTIIMIMGMAVLAAGAMMIGSNSTLIRQYQLTQDQLAQAADAGLELARARLNANPALYPDSGFATLELDSVVFGPGNQPIPGVRRSVYVGPVGITSGQFGVQGAVVSVARSGPHTVVRRAQVFQESFSRFAYFTDVEPITISFGGGDQIFGPMHSNDTFRVHSTGATFHGPVTTAGNITGVGNGTFRQGYATNAPRIPMPTLTDLEKLRTQAQAGGLAFTSNSGNADGRARMRIEFVAIDLNGDGDTTDDNEGFIRVYTSNSANWVVGANTVDNLRWSRNCGHNSAPHAGLFSPAADHPDSGPDSWVAAVTNAQRACHLGGAPELTNGWVPSNSDGTWLTHTTTPASVLSSRPDRAQLYPITRHLNPGFRGVIFVDGDVAVSGTVRSRVTLAATGNIVVADDITYSVDPSVGQCHDILGLFAGGNVVVSYTPVNAPWRRGSGQSLFSYDETASEFIHGFILTLNEFRVEAYDSGPTTGEACQSTNWGRGCLFLTGGIIQRQRGAVGTSGGTGYVKRYSYDPCGASAPPPYYPTTGRFSRGAHFDVDPTGFDITAYFAGLTAGT